MSLSDFIKEMSAEGQKVSQGGQGVVGRVLLEFGVYGYAPGHDFWEFWTVTKSRQDIAPAMVNLSALVQDAGGDVNKVNFGVRVTLFKDVLGREHYKGDLVKFTSKWQEDAYNLICQSASENKLPFNEIFYGQIQFKANPYHVGLGEDGKKVGEDGIKRFPTIKVPVKKFANKDAAQAFVDGNMPTNGPALPFSKTALSNYGNDVSNILAQAEEIGKHIWNAYQGKDAIGDENNPLPELKLPPPQKALVKKSADGSDFLSLDALIIPEPLKDQIAALWMMEASDIDLIQQEKANPPF